MLSLIENAIDFKDLEKKCMDISVMNPIDVERCRYVLYNDYVSCNGMKGCESAVQDNR